MSIVDIANDEARKNNVSSFEKIELQIGTLSGIEFGSLEFSWLPGTKNSVLEKAELIIDKVQAKGNCMDCGDTFPIDSFFCECPNCKSYLVEVIQGKELKVKQLVARID